MMHPSSLVLPIRRRILRVLPYREETLASKARASFARARERFAFIGNSAWAFSSQPDHLLAYAIWSETLADRDTPAVVETTEVAVVFNDADRVNSVLDARTNQ
ncbi:MAG: hypothetical protein ACYDAR_05265 [Thermomicrobiales bacterium]